MAGLSGQLDDRSVLAAARAAVRAEKKAGCQLLEAAADWADLHPSDSLLTPQERLEWYGEKAILFGGEGTPDVAESAAGTLGLEIGMNPDQARNLIADALDARHRMPQVWELVRAGRLRRDTLHRVAFRTRHLTSEQVGDVDQQIAQSLTRLTPGQRLENLLDAETRRVDRERLEKIAAEAVHDRYVRKGRPDAEGMTDLYIHTTSADAEASMASINHLARILKARKDILPAGVPIRGARTVDGGASGRDGTDCMDEWRAVAVQLLQTNPALAVRIQLQDQQPGLFDGAAKKITDPQADRAADDTRGGDRCGGVRSRDAAIEGIVAELVQHIDLTKLQPSATLHVHISDRALDGPFGPADPQARIARVEDIGPRFLEVVRQWLGEGCTVKLQPVIDSGDIPAVDRYEFPPAIREAMLTRSPASRFPWSNSLSRRNDLDHTTPYVPAESGGPPGQTAAGNGGPLTRREHRYKTFGPIAVRQPQPDTHVWKTKYGRVLIVNPSGTFDLGTGSYARAVWSAAERLSDKPSVAEVIVPRFLTGVG